MREERPDRLPQALGAYAAESALSSATLRCTRRARSTRACELKANMMISFLYDTICTIFSRFASIVTSRTSNGLISRPDLYSW